MSTAHIGQPVDRVDGRAKVTGDAKYAADYATPGLVYGHVVSSPIARGKIVSIDASNALKLPGVIQVFSHKNTSGTAWFDSSYRDQIAPPGSPFRPLHDAQVHFSAQPVALVVAGSPELARFASTIVRVEYETHPHATDLHVSLTSARTPKERNGIKPAPKARGHADKALAASSVRVDAEYEVPVEHHNPIEIFATTVVRAEDGSLTVYDKTQGVQNVRDYLCKALGFKPGKLRVVASYVGGAFGSGLRPQYQVFLAALAARELKRSVRVALTRQQMWSLGHRPMTRQRVALGASAAGELQTVIHEATSETSRYEDYSEEVVNWSGLLYKCENARFEHKVVPLDLPTPSDMRAPGAVWGLFALESAMDELDDVEFAAGRISLKNDPNRSVAIAHAMRAGGSDVIEKKASVAPRQDRYSRFTHSAIFAEVEVDEDFGTVRSTRVVSAIAGGRIINPKTARSQVMGGIVWGIGSALHEESALDHRFGRFMTHNLADYHVPVSADFTDIEVIFVDERDELVNPLGAKGLGEIGVIGVAAAIANAVFHATGKRIRKLPITLDKLL